MDIDDSVVVPKNPSPKRVRGPGISPARCCTYICAAMGASLVLMFVGTMIVGLVNMLLQHTNIHKEAFTANLTDVSAVNISRPLIDLDTRFDVALTIWARVPNNKTAHPEWYANDWDGYEADRSKSWPFFQGDVSAKPPKVPLSERYLEHEEKVLYSDIVISDYTLRHKSEDVQFKFELPLERFYDKLLYDHDVRATVVLLPHSPSRLDSVAGVSTFMPSHLRTFPWLSEFLNTSRLVGDRDSPYQQALGSLAVTWPLIEFHEEKVNRTNETTSLESSSAGNSPQIYEAPYLRTRLHAYIVNETRPTLRKTHDGHFKHLSKESCKRVTSNLGPSWTCNLKKYSSYGHWTAQYLMGGDLEEVAYPPFVDDLPHTSKHTVRLPIKRTGSVVDATSINVTFGFKFSTIHHRRQFSKDFYSFHSVLLQPQSQSPNATERDHANAHDFIHILSGVVSGHADEGYRPWTRVVLGAVSGVISASIFLLEGTYWWTRRTSTGISFPATWAILLNFAFGVYDVLFGGLEGAGPRFFLAIFLTVGICSLELPQLILVFPLSIGNYGKGWTVFKRRRTHRERASRRREPPWWQVIILHIILSCILAGIKKLAGFKSLWLIRPVYTSDTAESKPSSTLRSRVGIAALPITAKLCQMALNRSSGTFAGQFPLTAWLYAAELLLELAYFSTRVVGHYDLHNGLSPLHIVSHALTLLMLYQAIKYPRVEQNVPDDDEE
ncbi:uncharacterized protein LOC62_05G007176 [Vanrija pseudolonga]|uniref:Uncharacterized protein n=1 Tax=Vanrija pseudolonga TaxID=143232 RepID=A0AAF0YFJ0_9TREE|nr:hypothetical protein LOC62_05G007176 [Vanrija pseudolonga]